MPTHAVISVLALAYWTVFVVELIGDKSILTVTSLAARHRPVRVFAGISLAFMIKTGIAVLFGRALLQLPGRLTAAVSAMTLFVTAVALWQKPAEPLPATPGESQWTNGFTVAFAALLFSEWADPGQLSTAALAAQYQAPLAIWVGANAALMTKGLLALTLGLQIRRHVSVSVARIAAVASCTTLGLIAMCVAIIG